MVRGNRRRRLFRDDADRTRFLDSLFIRTERYGVRLYMYCLMDNHVHLLVETPAANISDLMESVLTSHATYYNLRWKQVGHVYQGRFKSPLVEGNEYLLRLSRYLHLNPVATREWKGKSTRARRVALRRYRWSSFGAYTGADEIPPELEVVPVLALCATAFGDASPDGYRRYVETGLAQSDQELEDLMRRSPLAVGSVSFRNKVLELADEQCRGRVAEDVVLRKEKSLRPPEEILAAVTEFYGVDTGALQQRMRGSLARAVACHFLIKHAGFTQRVAGRYVGIGSGAGVSLQLKKLREHPDADRICAEIELNL